ncbi:MAG: hypothetical protein NTX58_02610 [Actinobacteria bacterium]|nr:hypothetical protein [Actinomycetota bacterium]
MPKNDPHSYPAVGDDARFDAIVKRGTAMRRGRNTKRAATFGSLGIMAAAIAVFALVDTSEPSQASQVFADSAEVAPTTAPTRALSEPGPLSLSIEQTPSGATITLLDPSAAVAVAGEPPAQQCVTVTLRAAGSGATGEVLAEGFTCSGGSGAAAVTEVPLIAAVDGVQVGCAATAIRTDATPDLSEPLDSTFAVSLPAGMNSGNYQITAEAVSGLGDGCAGSAEGSSESEHSALAVGSFAL